MHISAGSAPQSSKTSQVGFNFEEKKAVSMPFRNGASVACVTMSVLSSAAQAADVLAEKACEAQRSYRLNPLAPS